MVEQKFCPRRLSFALRSSFLLVDPPASCELNEYERHGEVDRILELRDNYSNFNYCYLKFTLLIARLSIALSTYTLKKEANNEEKHDRRQQTYNVKSNRKGKTVSNSAIHLYQI